jgi:hypothetical protein
MQGRFHTMRTTGAYVTTTTLGEAVQVFVPHPLPPAEPLTCRQRRRPSRLPCSAPVNTDLG